MKTYTLDPDLLRFFGGQTGAVCPWPTRAEIQADLREFFGGIDPTPRQKVLGKGFPLVTALRPIPQNV